MNEIENLKIPEHIAFIMDGNGRWATKRGLPRTMGHRQAMLSLKSIVKACDKLGIKIVTVYAFSTENWSRPPKEVGFLMNLLVEFMRKELDELDENNVKIRVLGELDPLPYLTRQEIERGIAKTKDNTGLIFNIALNYGGRLEIVRSVKKIAAEVQSGTYNPEEIDEKTIEQYLYTAGQPDPDLMIRTSGEVRLSNFLLWQLSYSEFIFTDTYWPDFNEDRLIECLQEYTRRDRRFGGLK